METDQSANSLFYVAEGLMNIKTQVEKDTMVEIKEVNMEPIVPELPQEVEPSINLDTFRTLTKNKLNVIQNLILMTIESFRQYKNDYQDLIERKDQKEVGLLTHKLKLTSNILGAHKLEDAIKEVREILANTPEDDHKLKQATSNIHFEFDKCIDELQIELNKINSMI